MSDGAYLYLRKEYMLDSGVLQGDLIVSHSRLRKFYFRIIGEGIVQGGCRGGGMVEIGLEVGSQGREHGVGDEEKCWE
jgi:hypothetical protein